MPNWESYLETHQARFQAELLEFLRMPSISALPEHAGDVQRAAEWVAHRLEQAGLEGAAVLPTDGHPVVYGEWLHAPGRPTILIYGHFDTQPVDPLHLWSHPPFEPAIEAGRVYARGASDDKGNMLVPILAAEALLKGEGTAPLNLKFCFEGQEEIGSPQMPALMQAQRDRFACDLAVSADGGQWSETEPMILRSLRGACGVQLDLSGAGRDLHSGTYGGTIQNPIHALVRILDSLRSPEGRILAAGFYDDVAELTEAERAALAQVPFDEATYLAGLGAPALFGEPGYSTHERAWLRPTLEVNGIWGGFQGEGVKTVLPHEAHAKITCRLVARQEPARIVELLTAHIAQHTPPGVTATVRPLPFSGKPYTIPADHPGHAAVRAVHQELYGKAPYEVRSGGTIPICAILLEQLQVHTINFGFALPDERGHAPDEFFRLSSFVLGQRAYCKLLYRLAETALT